MLTLKDFNIQKKTAAAADQTNLTLSATKARLKEHAEHAEQTYVNGIKNSEEQTQKAAAKEVSKLQQIKVSQNEKKRLHSEIAERAREATQWKV